MANLPARMHSELRIIGGPPAPAVPSIRNGIIEHPHAPGTSYEDGNKIDPAKGGDSARTFAHATVSRLVVLPDC